MTDERYKQIMAELGMPNSRSLLTALQQVANEAGHAAIAAEREALKAELTALIDTLEPAIHQVGVRIVISEDDRVAICAAIDAARSVK